MGIHKKLQVILDLHAANPNKYRFDCPFCSRTNSLSIQSLDSIIKYKCFGATCKTSGIHKNDMSIEEINSKRESSNRHLSTDRPLKSFIPPVHWTTALVKSDCLDYLKKYGISSLYFKDKIKLRYDPKQNRLVFLVYDEQGTLTGATGRLLKFVPSVPKWLIYGKPGPFICGTKDVAVLVEDVVSAAKVSQFCTGIALLGTNFSETNFSILKRYKRIIVALDKDALKKSLEIENTIRYYADVSITLLNEDIKELDDEYIRELLGKHIAFDSMKDTS